ncbi:MAG: nucleotidyltransferase family protein [Pseudomonadota bacterium]
MPPSDLTVLILAAGSSRRFGEDKRRICLYSSVGLLQASVQNYLASGFPVRLVLSRRREDDDLAALFSEFPLELFRSQHAERGMGATLADAAGECRKNEAVAVALGDMPLIEPDTIRALASRLRPGTIVYPQYLGRRGHPVLFSSRFLPELAGLDGDHGAASVLATHAESCVPLPIDDPGIHLDADTPEALDELRRRYASRSSSGVSG